MIREKIQEAYDGVRAEQEEAGRSTKGRRLAVLATQLEQCLAWYDRMYSMERDAQAILDDQAVAAPEA